MKYQKNWIYRIIGRDTMEKVLQFASSTPIWIFALIILAIVIFQAFVFIKLALRTRESVGMTEQEVSRVLKVGAISAIGPAMGSMIIAISLITFLAEPVTLIRSVVIGSSAIEAAGANLAANVYGAEIGSADFTEKAYTTVVWTLCLGGLGWLLFTVFFTKTLAKTQASVAKKGNGNRGNIVAIISSGAMLGVFGNFVGAELFKGLSNIIVVLVAALTTVIVLLIANKLKVNWLRDWSMGLSILSALTVVYFTL